MKTLSVREVAAALEMTPRGVIQRLNKGQLKGLRKTNQFGVKEWLVYANKDIMQALERKGLTASDEDINFAPDDTETLEAEELYDDSEDASGPTSWRQAEIERLEIMAEKLVKPLAERIEIQAKALGEQERIIEDQRRQLLLLPDLQKQAEEERKAAELRALEVEALNKQIAALQLEQKEAQEAKDKISELEQALAENHRKSEEEIERLKTEKDAHAKAIEELRLADEEKLAEKEAESAAIQNQLQALSATVEELKKPKPSWWKRWFAVQENPDSR